MSLRSQFWRARFARWGRAGRDVVPGYSLLLPVPGDLPVFLELALAVCRLQDPHGRVETVVLPDRLTPAMRAIVERHRPDWPGTLRLLPLPALDRVVLPRLRDPGRNHGAQLVRGVSRARGSHVLLHDADLFLMDPQVHRDEWDLARGSRRDVVGLSPAWDPWYAGRGRELVATWEQVGRVDWYRAFPPHRHLGHDAVLDGERHTLDTTFWGQWHSRPEQLLVGAGLAERVIHLNYTISSYRAFQRSREVFHDSGFRVLLIRLFVELFGSGDDDPDLKGLPGLDELAAGLARDDLRVRYSPADAGTYHELRDQLGAIVAGPWSDPARAARCHDLLAAFDAHYLRTMHPNAG